MTISSTIIFFPALFRLAPATYRKETCRAAVPMFISVPFDELLHFIIISDFQAGVGDDAAILQLTLEPLQRSWV